MENRPGSFMFASAPLSERPFRHFLYIYCKRNSIFGNVNEEKIKKIRHTDVAVQESGFLRIKTKFSANQTCR